MDNSNTLRFNFEESDKLLDELNKGEGVSPELSRNMADELNQLRKHSDGILVVATEGTKTITIFLAPHNVVQGDGPVLVPTFDDLRVVSMVSQEFIEIHATACNNAEDQELAQEKWNALLDDLFDKTMDLADENNRMNTWLVDRP